MADLLLEEDGALFVESFYQPLPKQVEFHTAPAGNILSIGGNYSGKSLSLIGEALMVCFEYPGAQCLLLRKNFPELEKGLIADFKDTVPAELYKYNDSKHIVTFKHNGSKIFFGHCVGRGTLITTSTGLLPVEDVKAGDFVLTRKGYRRVKWSGQTGVKPVVRLGPLRITSDHRVFVRGKGWIPCRQVFTPGNEVVTHRSSFLTASRIAADQMRETAARASTIAVGEMGSRLTSTSQFTKRLTAAFQTATRSTIGTRTQTTTTLGISNLSEEAFTEPNMPHEPGQFDFLETNRLFANHADALVFAALASGDIAMPAEVMPVYDLEVEDQHEFFADGILVHNCKSGSEKDLAQYLSAAFVFIGIDELGQFSFDAYNFLSSRNRVNKGCKANSQGELPYCRMGAATNPMGPFYGWIRKAFIEKKPVSQLGKTFQKPDDPCYYQETHGGDVVVYEPRDWHYIHSTIFDNPFALERDPGAIARLSKLSPALRQRALYGDLNAIAGTYFTNFTRNRNVLELPKDRERIRWESWQPIWISVDWGLAHHSVVYWHRRAKIRDTLNLKLWRPCVITYREMIVNETSHRDLAEKIVEETAISREDNEAFGDERPMVKYLFLSPERFARVHDPDNTHTVANEMGVELKRMGFPRPIRANDRRVDGAVFMYNLIEAGEYFATDNCEELINSLETRVRDEKNLEDVLKVADVGDDCYDSDRYGLLSMLSEKNKPADLVAEEKIAAIEDPIARRVASYEHYTKQQEKKSRTFKPKYGGRLTRSPN